MCIRDSPVEVHHLARWTTAEMSATLQSFDVELSLIHHQWSSLAIDRVGRKATTISGVHPSVRSFVFFVFGLVDKCFSYFSGRHIRRAISESTGPIFTKFSGSVDLWKGLIMPVAFLRSLKGRCHGNQFYKQNRRNWPTYLHLPAGLRQRIKISERRRWAR